MSATTQSRSKPVYLQRIDLQAINSANLYRWQTIFRYLTLAFMGVIIFVSVFVINKDVTNIIDATSTDTTSDLTNSIIVPYAVSIVNVAIASMFSFAAINTANRRIYEQHRHFAYYIAWYFLYMAFALASFLTPLLIPNLSVETLQAIGSSTVEANGYDITIFAIIAPIFWLRWLILIYMIMELAYTIYSHRVLVIVNPISKRLWVAKIIALSITLIYALVMVALLSGDASAIFTRFSNYGTWLGEYFQRLTNIVLYFIGIGILLTVFIWPLVNWSIKATSIPKEFVTKNNIFFAYEIISLIAITINFGIQFENKFGFAANMTETNFIFLGLIVGLQLIVITAYAAIPRLRQNTLFLYITISFSIFLSINAHLIFNSIYGWSTRFSAINIFVVSVSITPILIIALLSKRQLENRGFLNWMFLKLFTATIVMIGLVLAILPFFSNIDDSISSTTSSLVEEGINTLFTYLNLWVLIYTVIAIVISIAFLMMLIKLLKSITLMQQKIYSGYYRQLDSIESSIIHTTPKMAKSKG